MKGLREKKPRKSLREIRSIKRVDLSKDEKDLLQLWALSKKLEKKPLSKVARIILLLDSGFSPTQIAQKLNVSRQTVHRWKKLFLIERLEALVR